MRYDGEKKNNFREESRVVRISCFLPPTDAVASPPRARSDLYRGLRDTWRHTRRIYGRTERTRAGDLPGGWILPGWSTRSLRESAHGDGIYSLGSPFATLEPLILPVGREILLEGAFTASDCGTRASPHPYRRQSNIRRTPRQVARVYKQVGE